MRLFCALTPEAKKAAALRSSLRHSSEALEHVNEPLTRRRKRRRGRRRRRTKKEKENNNNNNGGVGSDLSHKNFALRSPPAVSAELGDAAQQLPGAPRIPPGSWEFGGFHSHGAMGVPPSRWFKRENPT